MEAIGNSLQNRVGGDYRGGNILTNNINTNNSSQVLLAAIAGKKGGVGEREGFPQPPRKSDKAAKVDALLEDFSGLLDPQFKAWYAKVVYAIGTERFCHLAGRAKEGRNPRRFFSYLLRTELAIAGN